MHDQALPLDVVLLIACAAAIGGMMLGRELAKIEHEAALADLWQRVPKGE